MKSSKSNNKFPIPQKNFLWGIHLTTFQPRFVTHLNSPSTSRYIIMESRIYLCLGQSYQRTLPTTYPELAEYQSSSCRLLRHSNNPLWFSHWKGTPRDRGLIGLLELRALKVSWISLYILHPAKSRTVPVQDFMLNKLFVIFIACLPHGWHGRDHFPGHRMSGISRSYSIWNHPFIIIFECIITTLYSSSCGSHDRIL